MQSKHVKQSKLNASQQSAAGALSSELAAARRDAMPAQTRTALIRLGDMFIENGDAASAAPRFLSALENCASEAEAVYPTQQLMESYLQVRHDITLYVLVHF
jgi:hypothetical protein